ncbi:MAG: hypothetical protein MJY72_08715, partial [Bacteroidales bacterium]|nr:hypothetical protein [Bacteroidales bacterium]
MDSLNLLPQAISPTAYQIGQYGRTPVSYFHGLPQISVPLTEVRGRGFTLPVSLSYHGGGIKPEQHPGWVGLGWSLHAGGCITRVIHGKKDEYSRLEHNHLYRESPTADPGYIYHISDIQSGQTWTESELSQRLNPNIDEYEPDEYIVSAPGISATFVIVGDRQIRVKSREESCFTLEDIEIGNDHDNAQLNLYPGQGGDRLKARRFKYIKTIILRDKDGNRYIFGGTEESIEYSVVQHPNYAPDSAGNSINTGQWNAVATANTWMLTRIERADGEVFELSYQRNGVPIVFSDMHFGFYYGFYDQERGWPPRYIGSFDQVYNSYNNIPGALKPNYKFHFLLPCYLSGIRCLLSGDSLDFENEDSNELGYDYSEQEFCLHVADLHDGQVESYFPYSQFRLNDHYAKLVRIHGKMRDIRFDYTDCPETRLKLTGIRILQNNEEEAQGQVDSCWEFAYDSTPLPRYNSKMTDHWGYYNGHCYKTAGGSLESGFDNQRTPSEDFMKAETLISVRYPSGGWTEYDWEAHRYGMMVCPPDFIPENADSLVAGGLRIRSITDHASGNHSSARSFTYLEEGISTGVLSAYPSCVATGYHNINNGYLESTGFFGMYSETPILPLSETDGSHVSYTVVRETFEDGGYAEYRFSNNDQVEYRDRMPYLELGRIEGCPLFAEITSRSLCRGLLLRKSLYDSDGNAIHAEEMTYESIDGMTYASASKLSHCFGLAVFYAYNQVPCGYPSLRSRVVTERCDDGSLIVDSYEYTYNPDRLMTTEAHRRSSRGASPEMMSEETRYFYPADRPGPDHDDMVSEGFRGLVLGIAKLRDGLVVDAQEREYVIRHIPALPSERTVVIVGLAMRPVWLACRSYSARLDSPVTIDRYADSPMSCMQSTPDIEVKGFDGHASPLFAGMKDGSATEMVWSLRHGEPCMSIRTADRVIPPGVSSTRHQILVNYQDIVSKDFVTDAPSTFRCDMTPDYGYALHAMVTIDGTTYHLAQWSRPEAPDAIWQSLISLYQASLSLPIDSGRHTMSVRLLDWRGTSGSSETVGGSVVVTHATPAT